MTNNKVIINNGSVQKQASKNEESMKTLDIGCKLELTEININEEMKCTGMELFNALTRKDMIQIFTNCEAKMTEQAIEGGQFEMLGGNITGKFIEVKMKGDVRNHFLLDIMLLFRLHHLLK